MNCKRVHSSLFLYIYKHHPLRAVQVQFSSTSTLNAIYISSRALKYLPVHISIIYNPCLFNHSSQASFQGALNIIIPFSCQIRKMLHMKDQGKDQDFPFSSPMHYSQEPTATPLLFSTKSWTWTHSTQMRCHLIYIYGQGSMAFNV